MQAFFLEIFYRLQNNFSKLTINQKIQYYTLLEICHTWTTHIESEIQSFYKSNVQLINTLRKELITNCLDLTKLKEEKISQKQFFKEYKNKYMINKFTGKND